MRRRERYLAALLVFCAGGAVAQQSLPPVVGPGGSPAPAMRPTTVEGRLARVERLLDSGALVSVTSTSTSTGVCAALRSATPRRRSPRLHRRLPR
jgi:hypothetical protein